MILSKLILFFCFCVLLLDTSFGQQTILMQGENKKLFTDAIEYGKTYGGELGKLGSHWKQLLIQLVHAKRNVGLGKNQLARFNESATTEEVGLAIANSYADRVTELVAIRTQDIGATQKYIDDLEILKNEIALTMIVEMDETKKQFKEKNVRRKVKEAKENGITDTDIKDILFAEFFDSEGGLSLIDAAASIAKALLSSFRYGMECILDDMECIHDGTHYEKLGIRQYGNGKGDGDIEEDEYFAPGGPGGPPGDAPSGLDGTPGDAPGDTPGGASGGSDPPGGGGGDPRKGPPDDKNDGGDDDDYDYDYDDDDDEDPEDDRYSEDINSFFRRFSDVETEHNGGFVPEVPESSNINQTDVSANVNDNEKPAARSPRFSARQVDAVTRVVNVEMEARQNRIQNLEDEIDNISEERASNYQGDPTLQVPNEDSLTDEEKLDLYERRADRIQTLLNTTRRLSANNHGFRFDFLRAYYLARDNLYFYGASVGLNPSSVHASLVPTSTPDPIPEFRYFGSDDHYLHFISRKHMNALIKIGNRLYKFNSQLKLEIRELEAALKKVQLQVYYEKHFSPPKKDDTS